MIATETNAIRRGDTLRHCVKRESTFNRSTMDNFRSTMVVRMGEVQTKSIPTMYRGIRFRSRLEARWAAFFDAMAWTWAYEPIDLDSWIPDFEVNGRLAEVKPVRSIEDLAELVNGRQLANAPTGTLLLGVQPFGDVVGLVMRVTRALGPKRPEDEHRPLRLIESVADARKAPHTVEKMAKACSLRPLRRVTTEPLHADAAAIAKAWPVAMNETQYKATPARVVPSADPDNVVLTPEQCAASAAAILKMLGKRSA